MKKIFLITALFISLVGYGQTKIGAEEVTRELIGTPKDSMLVLMKGTQHIKLEDSDIFYVYSKRENKNIPLRFYYLCYKDEKPRVYKVEFVSRKSLHYKTTDLKTAFWIEYLKDNKR